MDPTQEKLEEVYADFKDSKKFYEQCDPEKDNLCLYGFPEGDWQVNPPMMRVPPALPEPALGINFARDAMPEIDWLSVVALHSDSWLLGVAFYYCAQAGLGPAERKWLFNEINDLPTVVEVFLTSRQVHDAPFCLMKQMPSVDQVYFDFRMRKRALIKALTSDVEMFYQQCGPEKGNLCLYGCRSGKWKVNPPVEKVPPEFPEPALGINFARDAKQEKDWLSFVGFHSDAWLLSFAFHHGARVTFDQKEREKLFDMINQEPTVSEIFTEIAKRACDAADN